MQGGKVDMGSFLYSPEKDSFLFKVSIQVKDDSMDISWHGYLWSNLRRDFGFSETHI